MSFDLSNSSKDSFGNMQSMRKTVANTTQLTDDEKHNAFVEMNILEWEKSKALQYYSVVVLLVLTFG